MRDEAPPSRSGEQRTVVVAGINGLRVNRSDLERAFSSVGHVEEADVGPAQALITFRDAKSAKEAVRRFNGGQLNDRTIDVYFEGEPPPRSGARGGRSRSRGRGAPGSRRPPEYTSRRPVDDRRPRR